MEDDVKLKVELEVTVTSEDIDDIMAGALEGGITYWCDSAEVMDEYRGEYASEQISRGGILKLHDAEEGRYYMLDKARFLMGVTLYIQNPHPYDILTEENNSLVIDTGMVDGVVCDMIIQYALFNSVIYS